MKDSGPKVFVVQGIDFHGIPCGEWIEADLHPITTQFGIDAIKAFIDLDIGKDPVDGTLYGLHKRVNDPAHIDLTDDGKSFLIAFFGWLSGL